MAFSCVFYAVIITAALMAVLYAILKFISRNIVSSVPFCVTGVVLAVLLTIQFTLLIGAVRCKGSIDSVQVFLEQNVENNIGTVSAKESQEILDDMVEEFPLIGVFIGYANFSGNDVRNLPEVMCDSLNSFFNKYILHRILWIMVLVVTACVIVMLYDRRTTTHTVRTNARVARRNYDDF
ncbi:MAG: hypothetical protein IJ199_06470 [Prevotella sp.]|nr:hypothetical protein [Prevotella sp.]